MPETMLILRGIAGHFGGKEYPHGALDEPAALEYAKRRGYVGRCSMFRAKLIPEARNTGRQCRPYVLIRQSVRYMASAAVDTICGTSSMI